MPQSSAFVSAGCSHSDRRRPALLAAYARQDDAARGPAPSVTTSFCDRDQRPGPPGRRSWRPSPSRSNTSSGSSRLQPPPDESGGPARGSSRAAAAFAIAAALAGVAHLTTPNPPSTSSPGSISGRSGALLLPRPPAFRRRLEGGQIGSRGRGDGFLTSALFGAFLAFGLPPCGRRRSHLEQSMEVFHDR